MTEAVETGSRGVCEVCRAVDHLDRREIVGYPLWLCQDCQRVLEVV